MRPSRLAASRRAPQDGGGYCPGRRSKVIESHGRGGTRNAGRTLDLSRHQGRCGPAAEPQDQSGGEREPGEACASCKLGRVARSEEIANVLAFLLSDNGAHGISPRMLPDLASQRRIEDVEVRGEQLWAVVENGESDRFVLSSMGPLESVKAGSQLARGRAELGPGWKRASVEAAAR